MMRRTADWKEYALDERRRANMAEQKLLLVNAELTCAKNAVTGVVKSWDSLKPGQYDKDIWETWLIQKMKPAIEDARTKVDVPVERLPDEMVRLIIAARVVAFEDQGREAIKELDTASEAFAECAPWKDQSDSSEWDGMSRCRKCRTVHSPNVACAKTSAAGGVGSNHCSGCKSQIDGGNVILLPQVRVEHGDGTRSDWGGDQT